MKFMKYDKWDFLTKISISLFLNVCDSSSKIILKWINFDADIALFTLLSSSFVYKLNRKKNTVDESDHHLTSQMTISRSFTRSWVIEGVRLVFYLLYIPYKRNPRFNTRIEQARI